MFEEKKKVLISIGGFSPAKKYGGPVVSITNVCKLLGGEIDIYVVTRDTDLNEDTRLKGIEDGWNQREGYKVLYLRKDKMNKNELKKIVKEVKPNVIYLNSFFDSYFSINLIGIASGEKIPVLLAPRGELCDNAFNIKKNKKIFYTKFYNLFTRKKEGIYYQSTSDEETDAIKTLLNMSEEKIFRLSNIPTLKKVNIEKESTEYLKLIYLSRIHPKKNLSYTLKIIANLKQKVIFDIFGPIEDKNYWESLQGEIGKLNEIHEIRYRGEVNSDDIHATFSQYDIFFFPTLSENYGHAIVESLSSNCKVLLSTNTPWNDVENYDAGWAISLENEDRFVQVLEEQQALKVKDKKLSNNAYEYILKKTDIEYLNTKYLNTFTNLKYFN